MMEPAMLSGQMDMKITTLRDRPDYASILGDWFQGEWQQDGQTIWSEAGLRQMAQATSEIPMTWILSDAGGRALATASLVARDRASDAFGQWLASVFTAPSARARGYASVLVEEAERHAQRCGFARILLTTATPAFYSKRGWQPTDMVVDGECVMRKSLQIRPTSASVAPSEDA
jgi:GNAT superfamily N-acetyltransferase